jgi:hypothetical protein
VYTGFWWGNLRKGDHMNDPGINRRIILRWIFRKWDVGGKARTDLAQNMGMVLGNCKCTYEPLASIKCREFLDYLRTS